MRRLCGFWPVNKDTGMSVSIVYKSKPLIRLFRDHGVNPGAAEFQQGCFTDEGCQINLWGGAPGKVRDTK